MIGILDRCMPSPIARTRKYVCASKPRRPSLGLTQIQVLNRKYLSISIVIAFLASCIAELCKAMDAVSKALRRRLLLVAEVIVLDTHPYIYTARYKLGYTH